ncbi:MAG: DUF1963 domain-containing protein [Micropepsaceae bacterium]
MTSNNSIVLKKRWPVHRGDRNSRSHLGGDPLMPKDEAWPTCIVTGRWLAPDRPPVKEPQPPNFLAQIDCAELPAFDGRQHLPRDGLLSFFHVMHEDIGNDDDNRCIVKHYRGANLVSRNPPETVPPFRSTRSTLMAMNGLDPVNSFDPVKSLPPESAAHENRRYGFVPISMHAATTHLDPDSMLNRTAAQPAVGDRKPYEAQRTKTLSDILGEPASGTSPSAFDSASLTAAYVARCILSTCQTKATASLDNYRKLVAGLDRGHVEPHIVKAWEQRGLSRQQQLEIQDDWRKGLSASNSVALVSQDLLAKIERHEPLHDCGDNVRQALKLIEPQLRMIVGQQELSTIVRNAWIQLLRLYDVEDAKPPADALNAAGQTVRGALYNANQLLGFPYETQSESFEKAAEVAVRHGYAPPNTPAVDMRLLAQFDTCFGGWGAMFADCGKAYFFLHRSDLEAHRFEHAVAIIDGG